MSRGIIKMSKMGDHFIETHNDFVDVVIEKLELKVDSLKARCKQLEIELEARDSNGQGYHGTRQDWIDRCYHAENLLEDFTAGLLPTDMCSCGHRREAHHIWGKCHGEFCKCTKFVHNGVEG